MDIMCTDNRFEIIDKAKKHLLEATNIDTSPDEMKVLDNFLFRCWQMGWLDRYDNCDPVDIHDELSERFSNIENVIREETAKMSEIIREAVVQKNTYVYKPTAPTIYWPNTWIPEACRSCVNHPSNGGTGICHCTLGSPSITCDMTNYSKK